MLSAVMQTLNYFPNQQKHWVPQLVPLMAGFTFLEGAPLPFFAYLHPTTP